MLVQPDVIMITGEKNDENLYICKIIHWTMLSVEHQLWPKQALGAAVSQKSHKITGEPSSAVVGKESLWKAKKTNVWVVVLSQTFISHCFYDIFYPFSSLKAQNFKSQVPNILTSLDHLSQIKPFLRLPLEVGGGF